MGHRAEIWSEVVADLRALVNALGKADLNETEKFRGADFATLMKAAAKCEGWEAEGKQMLAEMAGMQVRVVADKNLGVSVLREFFHTYPKAVGQYRTLRDWYDLF